MSTDLLSQMLTLAHSAVVLAPCCIDSTTRVTLRIMLTIHLRQFCSWHQKMRNVAVAVRVATAVTPMHIMSQQRIHGQP